MMIMTQVFSLQTLDSVFFPRKINITFEELVHVTSPASSLPLPRPSPEFETQTRDGLIFTYCSRLDRSFQLTNNHSLYKSMPPMPHAFIIIIL